MKSILNSIFKTFAIVSSLTLLFASCAPNEDEIFNSFTDTRDGHVYKTVTIGTQTWMAENLAYLPAIHSVVKGKKVEGSKIEPRFYVYGYYEGESVLSAKATKNFKTYGVLYNWPAAVVSCPTGWHLPSDDEWHILEDYQINYGKDIVKSLASNSGWDKSDIKGTIGFDLRNNNSSGFSALPGGGLQLPNGYFSNEGFCCWWWTSSEYETSLAWDRFLSSCESNISRYGDSKSQVFYIRCIKD